MRKIPEPAPHTLLGNPREVAASLAYWLDLCLPTGALFVPAFIGIGLYLNRMDMVVVATFQSMVLLILLAFRLRLRSDLVTPTAAAMAVAINVCILAITYVVPSIHLLLPMVGVLTALVCTPYLSAAGLRVLLGLTWVVFAVAMVLGHYSTRQDLPWWSVFTIALSHMGIVFAALLRVNQRLYKTMFAAWCADRQQTFLAQAGATLAESLDLQTTLATAARLAVPFLGDACMIDVLASDGRLERMAVHGMDHPAMVPLSNALHLTPDIEQHSAHPTVQAIRTGHCVLFSNPDVLKRVLSDAHDDFLNDIDIRSMMSVPISAHGRVLGALLLMTIGDTPVLSTSTIAAAEELSRRVGLCMDNARLYKEARDAVHLRDDFLSIASHELRTPLTTLRLQTDGAVRLLRSQGDSDRVLQRLTMAQQSASRLESLIRALLEVNAMNPKATVLGDRLCDLRILARDIVDRFSEEATRVGSTLQLAAPKEVWGTWDMVRLDQVLTNLVTNAIKYGAGSPINLKVVSDSQNAYFSVADRGIGIAAEDQERIFDRFERAVSTRNYGGFGLGLWVVRTLVNAAGGEIEVVSKPKEGAVFTVTLPRNLAGSQDADITTDRGVNACIRNTHQHRTPPPLA